MLLVLQDLASVEAAIKQCDGDFAAIIVSAFRWDFFHDLEWPTVEFLQGVRKLCDEHGGVFIMDDIRSTLRIDIKGTWKQFGVHPDLCCQCKGIANGQPLSAIIGVEKLRAAAAKVTATGSFWPRSKSSRMAVSIRCSAPEPCSARASTSRPRSTG
jgi:glutamate-1-semialdehyde 2,1-aminomutase